MRKVFVKNARAFAQAGGRRSPEPVASPALDRKGAMVDQTTVAGWAEDYRRVWEERDSDAAASLFTEDATYRSDIYEAPREGRDGVVGYWSGVTATQGDVVVRVGSPLVVGARGEAQPDPGLVGLDAGGEDRRQPRGLSGADRQHPRGEGVERAGMADATEAERAAHAVDHVVGGRALGLVDDQDAVRGRQFWPSPSHGFTSSRSCATRSAASTPLS